MENYFNKNKINVLSFVKTVFFVSIVLVLSLFGSKTYAAVRTSTATGGLWTTGTTWVGGVAPANGDSVIIATTSGNSVTVGANTTNAGLTINLGAVLNFSGAFTLTENGDVIDTGSITGATGILKSNSAGITIDGSGVMDCSILVTQNFSFASTANLTINNNINSPGRTVTNNGIVHLNGNYARTSGTATWVQGTNSLLNINGIFTPSANVTLTASASGNTIVYDGSAQAVEPATYYNLTFSGSGAKSITTGTAITGNLSISPTGTATASIGAGLNISVGTLTLGGLGTINGTWGSTSSAAINQNNSYFAATTGIVTVTTNTKANQSTLTLTGQTVTYPTSFVTLSTTGGSGTGAVSYSVTTAGTAGCSVVGSTLSYTSVGTCGVTATKAGDSNYNSATSAEATFTVNNPLPTTTSISPTFKNVGSTGFTLTVNGTNFVSTSVVNFNGSARTTTYVNSTRLTASILAGDLSNAGTFNITVTNPAPSGGTSNAQIFTVNNLVPTTTSISPATKTAGDAGFTLTVNGTNFVSNSVINFNGSARVTTYVSATQLTAVILTGDLTTAGIYNITVTNPAPGGGTSNSQVFTVGNGVPITTYILPTNKIVGDTGFTLTVNGTGFLSGSVVKFNGITKVTTYISSTKLSALILTADLATAGSYLVVVENPAPGGGDSNAQIFTVHNISPAITNLSVTTKPVGSAQFILTVHGANFLPTSVVNFGGSALATTYVSATQITAVVSASYLATAGTYSITVYNSSTLETSNSQSFTVGILGRHEFNYSKTFYGSGSLKK